MQVLGSLHSHAVNHLGQHAVDCVPDISEKYFENGRTLVVSLSANNMSKQDEEIDAMAESVQLDMLAQMNTGDALLRRLHLALRWPIAVYCTAEEVIKRDPRDWDTRNSDKHGSYVLFVRHQNGILNTVNKHMQQLESLSAWNSRANFVVVVDDYYTEDKDQMLKDIFKECWKWNVFNLVILLPVTRTSTYTSVGVYTWYPYRLPFGRCGELHQVFHMNTCLSTASKKGRYLNNSPIFDQKIPNNLNGCPFRVATLKFHPFIIYDNYTLDGSEIRLISNLADKMNVSLKLRVSLSSERKGQQLSNGTWTGLRGELIYGSSDMIFGHILTNLDDHLLFDDTIVYSSDKFTWFIARADAYPRWLSMARVFTPKLWIVLLISIPVAAFVMKWLSRKRSVELWSYAKSVFAFWAALLCIGADMPYSTPLRIFFLSWVMFSLAVNTVFQTYVTSYLVDPGLQHQIDSAEELYGSNSVFAFPGTIDKFFTKQFLDNLKPRIRADPVVCLDYVANKDNFATVAGRKLVEYFSEDLAKRGSKHEIFRFREDLFQLSTVMLLPKGNPLHELVNKILFRTCEAGLVDKFYKDIIIENQIKAGIIEISALIDEYIPLSLSHLQASFLFLFLGLGISSVVLLLEKSLRRK
ncbi:hypothetical protein B7P43_G07394 [Cryptotermes secundus]|uniref:Putative ionotropic receptor ligand binding domain-containing protein n=1 Tax=Cryptotermes secundus TaxID=105785 RepID=A0A2J7RAK4_9NEOP|nr:glutamate receptor 3 [Cryptotermes secundus]PNF37868.1 hypothetical protein B7P43_G07394 [Cryptotermes secundus]